MDNILSLPHEIIVSIFYYCSNDIVSLTLTCKKFNYIIINDDYLKIFSKINKPHLMNMMLEHFFENSNIFNIDNMFDIIDKNNSFNSFYTRIISLQLNNTVKQYIFKRYPLLEYTIPF